MYDPVQPRFKKTQIIRTRSGCHTCRRRHRKCDEKKPECNQCIRMGFRCEGYSLQLTWRINSVGFTSKHNQDPSRVPVNQARVFKSGLSSHGADRRDLGSIAMLQPREFHNSWVQSSTTSTLPDCPNSAKETPICGLNGSLLSVPMSLRGSSSQEFLLSHFHTHVSTRLSPVIRDGFSDLWLHPCLKPAILALSASSLFHFHLFRSGPCHDSTGAKLVYMPEARSYLRTAVAFYGEALCILRTPTMLSGGDLDLQLALTLLLALFEWESGSVEACFMHITGADALSLTSHDQISKTSSGLRLLGSWAEMRTQKNGHKLPFRPLDEELIGDRTTQTMILSKRIAGHSIPSLSFLLTEAYCLRNRLVLQSCMNLNGIDSESTLRICRAWYSRAFDFTFEEYPETEVHSTLSLEDLLFRLSTTRWLLEEWRAALPAKALPSPLQTSVIYTLRPTRLHPAPVLQLTRFIFQECGAAIQFLRYQIGCFLSSRDILDSYLTRSRPPLPNEPLGPEATLILSIIESLDPSEDSLHYTFDEGILWILNVLPVCIPDIRVTSYLLDIILPRLEHYGSFKPLLFDLKTRQMLVGIHSEIEAGRLPLLYDPNVLITDDIALNNNRLGSKAAVLGRTLEGGSFQDVVELPPVAVSRGTFIQ